MRTLGIIAAAGQARRFGGTLKELLPIGNHASFLSRNVFELSEICDDICIITNQRKIAEHAAHLGEWSFETNLYYALQEHSLDIYGAIHQGCLSSADQYIFVMADTYWDASALERIPPSAFSLGVFQTDKSERFGMLRTGYGTDQPMTIVNKEQGPPGYAWGILAFNKSVRDYWLDRYLDDYTQALNFAIKHFDYETFGLEYYYDIASFDDYVEFLNREQEEH